MSKIKLQRLIKFGEERFMRDLYENGTIYFNTVEKFRTEEEKDFLRGDNYEGTKFVSNVANASVFLIEDETEHLLGNASLTHIRGFGEQLQGNLYCMYAIHPGVVHEDGSFAFDSRLKNFGTHCVIINSGQNPIFLQRIWEQLDKSGYSIYGAGLVEYYDHEEPLLLETSAFMKRKGYDFQNEFRIAERSGLQMPFQIQIGSLKDIATIQEISSIIPQL